jgi:hypothetical protein
VIIVVVSIFSTGDYWKVGFNKNLLVISVRIDTFPKYLLLLVFIAVLEIARVTIEEIASPVLGFNVYNPDKKHITGFSRSQLAFLANAMFLTSNLRSVFLILLQVSQIDIAVWTVIMGQIASIVVIHFLLKEKTFDSEASVLSLFRDSETLSAHNSYGQLEE